VGVDIGGTNTRVCLSHAEMQTQTEGPYLLVNKFQANTVKKAH